MAVSEELGRFEGMGDIGGRVSGPTRHSGGFNAALLSRLG
jgi:hypothetical protein